MAASGGGGRAAPGGAEGGGSGAQSTGHRHIAALESGVGEVYVCTFKPERDPTREPATTKSYEASCWSAMSTSRGRHVHVFVRWQCRFGPMVKAEGRALSCLGSYSIARMHPLLCSPGAPCFFAPLRCVPALLGTVWAVSQACRLVVRLETPAFHFRSGLPVGRFEPP